MSIYHIIIADDHDTVRTFLVRICARFYPSATLTAVTNGVEALAAFAANPADLVITNADMPKLNGIELVRALRAQQSHIPILLLSADARMQEPALAAGADRFLLKPPDLAELRQTLATLLPP